MQVVDEHMISGWLDELESAHAPVRSPTRPSPCVLLTVLTALRMQTPVSRFLRRVPSPPRRSLTRVSSDSSVEQLRDAEEFIDKVPRQRAPECAPGLLRSLIVVSKYSCGRN